MNERPSLYDGPAHRDWWEDPQVRFPHEAFQSEFRRSLSMLEMTRQYLSNTISEAADGHYHELRGGLDDMALSTARLERTLTNMMSLLRCQQGAEAPRWEPVELCAFLQTLCSEQELIRKTLGVELTLDCGGMTECWTHADPTFLSRICLHLLTNALRACRVKAGRVAIALRSDGGVCTIRFTDTGCGLPREGSRQENYTCFLGGTRAGLLLCSEYCRLTGWTLELRPRPKGRGAEALLTLPPRSIAGPNLVLRSVSQEDILRAERRIWYGLALELTCLPGMEAAKLQIAKVKIKL